MAELLKLLRRNLHEQTAAATAAAAVILPTLLCSRCFAGQAAGASDNSKYLWCLLLLFVVLVARSTADPVAQVSKLSRL
jgi:hypothetical protein